MLYILSYLCFQSEAQEDVQEENFHFVTIWILRSYLENTSHKNICQNNGINITNNN